MCPRVTALFPTQDLLERRWNGQGQIRVVILRHHEESVRRFVDMAFQAKGHPHAFGPRPRGRARR